MKELRLIDTLFYHGLYPYLRFNSYRSVDRNRTRYYIYWNWPLLKRHFDDDTTDG